MTNLAWVLNTRTQRGSSREFDNAELAAGHLLILLRADGFTDDPATTIRRLVNGETIRHKSFAYSVQ